MTNNLKIRIDGVTFSYEKGEPVIDDFTLDLSSGEVVALISPVGGGKSTLLKICAGLIQPNIGEVFIENKNVWNLSEVERGELRRRMGFVFQEAALIANMSIFKNLELPLSYHGVMPIDEIESVISSWLAKFELNEYRNKLPAALSLGLRRRVSFIRAMLTGSDYFFWDDPTAGVADGFSETIRDAILEHRSRGAVQIIVTGDEDLMKSVADRIVVV